MKGILDKIIEGKFTEVEKAKERRSLATVRSLAESSGECADFMSALIRFSDQTCRVIAECKRMSPSKGVMRDPYDPLQLACDYEKAGAAAVSVLTDEKWFGGSLDHLREISENISLPCLRKDFIVDEYQIYEARASGAASFLLLAGVLDHVQLQYFIEIGRDLGMEPLVESHNQEQLDIALRTDAKIMGINNRNLDNFSVDLERARELYRAAEKGGRIVVCESGINGREDILAMERAGFGAFLIGEHLVRAENPTNALLKLRGL